ncbi:MAG: type II toxin-antitoxin system HicB family antitoxin [SAR202 cluster bacterium]|nr:type II toxin-antitoxin system HicB family antitoxin [SAR202 cluster bacterium]
MKLYKLPLVIHEPSEETEDKYMAEVPALPGCKAWGDTPTEAMENLQSVAAGFIDSYRTSGDPLPSEVEAMSTEPSGAHIPGEFTVAV